jgi:hypothetical protein
LTTTPGLVVIRHFDERLTTYTGAATKDEIVAFTKEKLKPVLANFDDDTVAPIFNDKQAAIILFSNDQTKDY